MRLEELVARHLADYERSLDTRLPWWKRKFYRLRWWWA